SLSSTHRTFEGRNLGYVGGFSCRIDGGAAHACGEDFVGDNVGGTARLVLDGLAAGPHTLRVSGTDRDRGTELDRVGAYWDWSVDTAAPAVTIMSQPTAATPSAAGLVSFSAR